MAVEYNVIFAYAVGIILLLILGRIFLTPMKVVMKLFYNSILGGIILVVINLIGTAFSFHIALNIPNTLIVGFLGVPGVVVVLVLKYFL